MAKGFNQQLGVDFVDTYSPIAKFTSNRIIMFVVTRMDYKQWHAMIQNNGKML